MTSAADIRADNPLRFGLVVPPMWRSWDEILDLFLHAERLGFDSAFVTDHFLSDWDGEEGDVLEGWTLLAALAREVPRIDLGVFVTGVTHRLPAVLIKQAFTLDRLSGGRHVFGIGAAWNEREHDAYGIPFPAPRVRVDLVEDTLIALRLAEVGAPVSFGGKHLRLEDAPFYPRPQRRLPILMGGKGDRMLRLVARHADLWDVPSGPIDAVMARCAMVDAECARIGRDPGEITLMHEDVLRPGDPAGDLEERVSTHRPHGMSYFLVNAWPKSDPGLVVEAAAAIPRLRPPG